MSAPQSIIIHRPALYAKLAAIGQHEGFGTDYTAALLLEFALEELQAGRIRISGPRLDNTERRP